jgi:CHASE3 domain sensor protein
MLLIILTNLWERKNIHDMNTSVTSIYDDRLVPATDLFHLTEQLYKKRFLLENFLITDGGNHEKLKWELEKHDEKIETLIGKYEQTYLVDQESKSLQELKKKITAYKDMENTVIETSNHSKELAFKVYQAQGESSLISVINPLIKLTDIQAAVGGELIKSSKGILANAQMLSTLQIILAIITGIVAIILIISSTIVNNQKSEKFNLN